MRLGNANVVHMKRGGAGHETWAYFKFTDKLRGGTINVLGGTACSRHGWSGGPFISDTDGPGGLIIGGGGAIGSMTCQSA